MEFIIVLIVIAVLCLVIGVKASYLIFAAIALIGVIVALSELLLTVCFIRLLFAKKQSAVFSRIDKGPHSSFKVAYYRIDNTEYPNIFPEEGFFRSKLYRSDKSSTVFLSKNKKTVFDKFSCATCTIGILLTIATIIAAVQILSRL
ncbi:MAG: hypothetical protein K6G33_00305 [Ruminococcus sp.]|uniref:hypothetical protein n=1 Tax=Ruminococcus sp. TaxID=41978 RepID=UPI0025DF4F14|nr:hypothetical protein [Ruminococcus sp.]MCR5599174.1 hypothetical protein [Ruminococcus sp.]